MDTVICFGEILWDVLPDARCPGGAPFNVAYHLHRLGLRVIVASAVGRDQLGAELLQRLAGWGIDTSAVARISDLPTGTVEATISASGDARYRIAEPVAWDAIPADAGLLREVRSARALVFGSLALRAEGNRVTLGALLDAAPADCLRVFDVNLRPPYDDPARVEHFARRATVLKLNSAEAARLGEGGAENPGREERDARTLAARSGATSVCVTAGERGAGLLRDGAWTWEPGRRVAVADTVGAGDAFLARLLAGKIMGREDSAAMVAGACRLGEWVATRRGATPDYDASAPVPVWAGRR